MSSPEQSEMSQKAYVDRYAQFVLKPQKPIQPYICSTLSDFQEERDFLADYIFPQLNELCNSQGTYFKAVDLRWSALKAPPPSPSNLFRQHSCLHSQYLKLCLDYVNSCFPFFICMLGQTYGDFLPDHVPLMLSRVTDLFNLSMVEQNLYIAAKNGYPWVLENPSYSLMEFEVIQAAFLNESPFQYFYFRTGTMLLKTLDEEKEGLSSGSLLTDEEKLRIGKLKAKIIRKGLRVRFYKDLHELGDLVFKDWSVVIEQLYPATLMIRNIVNVVDLEQSVSIRARCSLRGIWAKSEDILASEPGDGPGVLMGGELVIKPVGIQLWLKKLRVRDHYKVTMLHWAAFHNASRQWVQEKPNGLLYFRHQSLQSAVEHKLLGRVLNNLVKSASEKYLKENHILECATETSSFLDNNPCDQATMKYTEGVLIFAARDTSLAKMRLQECLNIRRSLFGEKNILVGEIMEFLADLLSFLPEESERCQRKQAIEYYKQVIRITENAGTFTNSSLVRKQLSISLSDTLCKLSNC
ncbi:putative tetratricopeptide repeat protein 41 [Lynx canadensis]|uniref:putative tetratricopeptide repeat protein 41 n=1 Tax=Lynx canadensis TaxID=61383 RepID=UPI0013C48ABE|nr:putative tetratricopeptide repeat protein 41 [Lynx canadensis]